MLSKLKLENGHSATRPFRVALLDHDHHHHHHHHHRHQDDRGTLKGDPLKQLNRSCCSLSVQAKCQLALFVVIFLVLRNYFLLIDFFRSDPYSLDEYLVCDRSDYHTDVCQMKGDVRVDGKSKSILLFSKTNKGIGSASYKEEKIKPYTRKWEELVMSTINEITLREILAPTNSSSTEYNCDVEHKVPAVVFSIGGHSSNFDHALHDAIIPMFIATDRFHGEVVFVILEYHDWWVSKYGEIFRQLSHYDLVDFNIDTKVHCFPEVSIGLKMHGELMIDSRIDKTVSMANFQQMIHNAYGNNPNNEEEEEEREEEKKKKKKKKKNGGGDRDNSKNVPSLLIISREGSSRYLVNGEAMAKMAQEMGFKVVILKEKDTMDIKSTYKQVQACDIMVGVHGAGLTHFMFLRPGSSLIQVIPLGLEWPSLHYYGKPAIRLGMRYVDYHILPQESTLSKQYPEGDPVLVDSNPMEERGLLETKHIYLDGQNITLDLARFHNILLESYKWATKPSLVSPSLLRHQI